MEESNTRSSFNPMIIVGAVVLLIVAGVGVMLASNKSQSRTNTVASSTTQGTSVETAPEGMPFDEEGDESVSVDQGTQPSESQVAGAETDTDANVQVVSVEAGSFYFKPNEIHTKVGQSVKIVMTAKDMMHDFYIDELGVKLPITKAGETNTVTFTPTQKGTFEFYCSVGNHRQQGQVGRLIVE